MTENLERRDYIRIDHTSPLNIKDLKSGKIYKARMFNYNKNGLYFETDSDLQKGDQIYIGIQDSPYASESNVLEYYRGEIMWRKKLEDSHFDLGYGVKLFHACKEQSKRGNSLFKKDELNETQTESFRKTIKFSDHHRTYEGLIKDISPSGVFFVAQDNFEEGQMLTFEVPLKNGRGAKIKGQIVWADDAGLGVIFLN